jgi:hypothetical protein
MPWPIRVSGCVCRRQFGRSPPKPVIQQHPRGQSGGDHGTFLGSEPGEDTSSVLLSGEKDRVFVVHGGTPSRGAAVLINSAGRASVSKSYKSLKAQVRDPLD